MDYIKTLTCALMIGASLCASAQQEKADTGTYEPTWQSLSQYECPEWFRNAKFGIWAHWGPQCQAEAGDWYGRGMYEEGSHAYKWHLKNFGHPTEVGFKDVIHQWTADEWDPESLVALYKKVGAQYFFAMGNHHDNMDLWDSKYQKWNSVNLGPQRDILGEWEQAARKYDLPFGVSIHSSHAWTWYEPAQGADKKGDRAGISYDARVLTKEDGAGTWWEGYDPQELYVQNHALSIPDYWDWAEGTSVPTQEYYDNFFDRTVDMINKYNPDLIYFDDSVVPFWPIDDTGLKVISHYYNHNMNQNGGELSAVVFGKKLTDDVHQSSLVWDVEKGVLSDIQPRPWQTCTCLGNWHYDRGLYEQNRYKSAPTVIKMLIDIVSKNGNLLLSVPVRGNGTIDEKEVAILEQIGAWMDVNKEGIFDTRPWVVYGEGPRTNVSVSLDGAGFNEGSFNDFTSDEIRFTQKGNAIYAHVMDWPTDGKVLIRSLAKDKGYLKDPVKRVDLLGYGKVKYKMTDDGLLVTLPKNKRPNDITLALKITH